VVTNHLQDHGAGTEGAASPAAVPAPGEKKEANKDADTNTQEEKHEDTSGLIKMWRSSPDGLSEGAE